MDIIVTYYDCRFAEDSTRSHVRVEVLARPALSDSKGNIKPGNHEVMAPHYALVKLGSGGYTAQRKNLAPVVKMWLR